LPLFFWNFSLERLSRPYKKNVYTIRTNITVPQKQNSRNKNEVQVQYNMKQEQKCIEIQSTVSWGSSQQAYTNHKLSFWICLSNKHQEVTWKTENRSWRHTKIQDDWYHDLGKKETDIQNEQKADIQNQSERSLPEKATSIQTDLGSSRAWNLFMLHNNLLHSVEQTV
jgi:hypothetical protein